MQYVITILRVFFNTKFDIFYVGFLVSFSLCFVSGNIRYEARGVEETNLTLGSMGNFLGYALYPSDSVVKYWTSWYKSIIS